MQEMHWFEVYELIALNILAPATIGLICGWCLYSAVTMIEGEEE